MNNKWVPATPDFLKNDVIVRLNNGVTGVVKNINLTSNCFELVIKTKDALTLKDANAFYTFDFKKLCHIIQDSIKVDEVLISFPKENDGFLSNTGVLFTITQVYSNLKLFLAKNSAGNTYLFNFNGECLNSDSTNTLYNTLSAAAILK